jgi:hypothetical protein
LAWLGEKYSNFLLLFRRTIPRRDKMVVLLLNGKSAKYNLVEATFGIICSHNGKIGLAAYTGGAEGQGTSGKGQIGISFRF